MITSEPKVNLSASTKFRAGSLLAILALAGFSSTAADFTSAPLRVAGETNLHFTLLPSAQTGVTFSNFVSRATRSLHTLIPSGLAAGDVDGDGLCDLYFCSTDGANKLYRNLGNWRFEEITAPAGLEIKGQQQSVGATFADVNGDGPLDLIVTARGGPNRLYLNDGKGHFTEDMNFIGRKSKHGSTSIAVADVNGDGALDIYICNYRVRSYPDDHLGVDPDLEEAGKNVSKGAEIPEQFKEQFYVEQGGLYEKGEPDDLLLNDGHGHFTRADDSHFIMPPGSAPPAALEGMGLAVQFRDVNGDGFPDIYVCNDFHSPDRLWLNDGHGYFTLASSQVLAHTSFGAMAVDFADINLDGHLDFFIGDMLSRDHARRKQQMGLMKPSIPQTDNYGHQPQYMQNTLFLNRGDNTFAEIAPFAGVKASEWTWGSIFMDADLDGYPDLLISCGNLQDWMDADTQIEGASKLHTLPELEEFRVKLPALKTHNLLFRNKGDLHFEEVGAKCGFDREDAHSGMVTCDLDNDGDLDVVVVTADAPVEMYRNDNSAPRIAVKLHGKSPNTSGIGAKVKLIGKSTTQMQELIGGGRYASGCDYSLTFATPAADGPYKLQVIWRNGRVSEVAGVKANQSYTISEINTLPALPKVLAKPNPLFEDASAALNHTNRDENFDDFKIQPLLPNRLSRLGPGVSWFDIDGDGKDDVLIGAARGQVMGIYKNLGGGRFEPWDEQRLKIRSRLDVNNVVGWGTKSEGSSLVLGISAWKEPTLKEAAQFIKVNANGTAATGQSVSRSKDGTGPLALADVNGDGTLDLFIGGRVKLSRYPEPADSMLVLRNSNGQLAEAGPGWSEPLKRLGLVSSATFADINGDGRPDLLAACEWGPVAVLLNTGSGFTNATAALGLDQFTGWWNGVAVGDFDGDGKLDFVASNWGQGSKYQGSYGPGRTLKIFYGDFNGNGAVDIVEAHLDSAAKRMLPERGLSCSSTAMPFIKGSTPTFYEFAHADLEKIYGDKLSQAATVEARDLRHMVFLNRGDHFEALPLPVEAQLTASFGVAVADFDGDGNQDVFMAQNFFAGQVETPRLDAGRGLLLLGDGTGKFRPATAAESGIAIYGEQRGCAVSDYDGDGRVDVLVAQPNDQTKLLHNRRARPGLRVHLEGGAGNPQAVGAVVRPVTAAGAGAAQVVSAGSGYWSQNSATLVVTSAKPIIALSVRWPDGRVQEQRVPPDAKDIMLRMAPPN